MGDVMTAAALLARHGDHDGWGGGWMWVWGPLMMVFWVAVVAGAVYWIVRATQSGRDPSGTRRAQDILAERYARGELTTEEYRERLDALR